MNTTLLALYDTVLFITAHEHKQEMLLLTFHSSVNASLLSLPSLLGFLSPSYPFLCCYT